MTDLHDAGLELEGAIPTERIEDAARTLARAALGRPARDLATTRRGALNYALARRVPRRLLDRVVATRLRQLARRGDFDRSELVAEYAARVRASGARPG